MGGSTPPHRPGLRIKRFFDVLLALVVLPFLLPVLFVIAVAIVFDSRGPVFYRGVRTGRFGRPFHIYKLRTMVADAEHRGGGTTAMDDERVTRVGRMLRRYKLDELPQVFNVLKGEMSFVGPRPELPQYTDKYSASEQLILSVPPGITDYSSLRFRHLDSSVGKQDADRVFEERVLPEKNRLRLRYVNERSFWGDILLIGQTILALFRGRP